MPPAWVAVKLLEGDPFETWPGPPARSRPRPVLAGEASRRIGAGSQGDARRDLAETLHKSKPPSRAGSTKIVVGRDARISGEMVNQLVIGTLLGMGFDVVNIGLATTPTTELAVTMEKAAGGIIRC